MEVVTGRYDRRTRMVTITVVLEGGARYPRQMRAVFDAKGHFDRDATEVQAGELARGMGEKIKAGVIQPEGAE